MTSSTTLTPSKSKYYTIEQLSLLDPDKIPHHVAIIMDGSRRWAKSSNLHVMAGHWEGAEVLSTIVKAAEEIGIKVLTVYAFSTENWSRSPEEINELMNLFEVYLREKREPLLKDGVRLDSIGDLSQCSQSVQDELAKTKKATENCSKIELVLALNYGARDEIRRAIGKILTDYDAAILSKKDVTEDLLSMYLDTAKWKDPELLIRTSGEQRLSNFLLWQLSYTEIIVSDVLWPEFSPDHLFEMIMQFQKRQRRLGGA